MRSSERPPTQSLSETDVLILLTERPCRETLRVVQESASPIEATELARCLVDRDPQNASTEELEITRLALQNDYLPRLDEAAVVEYEPQEGTVRPGLNFDSFIRFLERTGDEDLPWSDQ